jgi:hypothetical protein
VCHANPTVVQLQHQVRKIKHWHHCINIKSNAQQRAKEANGPKGTKEPKSRKFEVL